MFIWIAPASAIGPCDADDPPDSCFVTHTEIQNFTLTVTRQNPFGTVTSSPAGISCETDCSQTASATRECDAFDCSDWSYPQFELSRTGLPAGYTPGWSANCAPSGGGKCIVQLDADKTVISTATDTQAPTVSFSPPAKISGTGSVSASGTDNSGSATSFHWYVDAVDLGIHGSNFELGLYAPAGSHSVSVRSRDATGNESALATATVVVDKSAHVTISALPAITNTIPAVNFTKDADIVTTTCVFYRTGDAVPAPTACSSGVPAAPAAAADGTYNLSVNVTDDVGNSATATATFVLNRTAPVVTTPSTQPLANPALVTAAWKFSGRKTVVKKLVVTKLPAGAAVVVKCKGKGCPFKSKTVVVSAGQANVGKLFKRKALAPKAAITITITASGYEPMTVKFAARPHKAPKRSVS